MVDILNQFAENGESVILYAGEISNTQTTLNPTIEVVYFCKYNKEKSTKRIFTWLWFTIQVFFRLLFKSKKYELVIISTPPFITFLGLFFKRLFKQKYHLIMWDIYPDALLSMKIFKQSDITYRTWAKLNTRLLNKADTVITLGHFMAKALEKYYDNKIKPTVINNWVDTNFIIPKPKNENWFAKKYNQVDKFTVLYSGNFGDTHDFESLLSAAELLIDKQDINFVLIGEGAKKNQIQKIITDKKLSNVILLDFQEKETFPFSITTGDIGVIALGEGMEYASLPSKTYSVLAAGSVLLALASKNSEFQLMVDKFKCGSVFEKGDKKGISEYILGLYDDKNRLNILKENSRKASLNFTPKNAELYYNYICKKK